MPGQKEWQSRGERRLKTWVARARALPGLKRLGPPGPWQVEVLLIGSRAMTSLNAKYRRKRYATDVLSFPAPDVFRRQGRLGELVICTPVMARQARELGHRVEAELDVLLVHGLLHLLGFDHERGPRHAAVMARWEARLLGSRPGLVARSKLDQSPLLG